MVTPVVSAPTAPLASASAGAGSPAVAASAAAPIEPPRAAASPRFSRSFPRLDGVIAEIGVRLDGSAPERERERRLLHEPVRRLIEAGFGTLRVPASAGGLGGSLRDLFERLVHLAAIDPNLAHVFRGHVGFVEQLVVAGPSAESEAWFARIVDGALVGNAQSERAATADLGSVVSRTRDGLRLRGTKYYTTGSLYSDWILLAAQLDDDEVLLIVDAHHRGVRSTDDWDGFGQPLTGSGTTTFTDVPVQPEHVFPNRDAGPGEHEYVAGVFQLVLLAVIAGVARGALDDVVGFVRPRRRIFGFAGEAHPRDDALVQEVVGRVSAVADSARRLVESSADDLDAARAVALGGADERVHAAGGDRADAPGVDAEVRRAALRQAALDVYRVQQVLPPLVLDATTELFEVGGASAVGRGAALDRHWRNARTLFSHNPAVQRRRAIGDWELNGVWTEWGRRQDARADAGRASTDPTTDVGGPADAAAAGQEAAR